MAMWDDILNGLGIENGAAKVNQTIDEVAGQERGPGGSFDLNRIRSFLPDGMDQEARLQARLADARLAALRDNMKAPTRTGFQFLGDALSAASVPVAYAQGNTSYGSKMAGNTMADQFNDRRRKYEDQLAQGSADIMDGAYGAIGTSAVSYLKDRREKMAEARKTLAGLLSSGRKPDGSIDPAVLSDAEMFMTTQGFGKEWEELKSALKFGTPDAPAPAAPAPAPAPAASAPAAAPGPVLGGLSKMATNLPGAAPPPPPPSMTYERPPEVAQAYAQAQRVMMFDPERGKAMMQQAEIADRAAASVWQKKAESQFDAKNGQWSTTNTPYLKNKKTGEMRPAQFSSAGTLKPSALVGPDGKAAQEVFNPADWQVVDPAELAGLKSSMTAQGKAQGEAAAALPQYEREADSMQSTLNQLLQAPGREKITGPLGSLVPNVFGDARAAKSLYDQVNGKVFLQAYNNLRGAGQITEGEGRAATEAYSLLRETGVNDAEYAQRLKTFMKEVEEMRQIARKKAAAGLINPNATVIDIGRGKKLYKSADGNWYESQEEAIGQSAAARTSAGQTDRLSGMKVERVQ